MAEEKTKKAVKKKAAEKVEKILIDAESCSLGRLASYAAKEALNGKHIVIVNAEKALVSGKEKPLFADYKKRYDAKSQTNPLTGPQRPKNPDRFVRRTIRGMLPWGKPRGKDAFKRVMVYMGKPERELLNKEKIDLSKAKFEDVSKIKKHYDYYITVGELCKYLGGKNE
jgi:large subunit ribosomal protein L13